MISGTIPVVCEEFHVEQIQSSVKNFFHLCPKPSPRIEHLSFCLKNSECSPSEPRGFYYIHELKKANPLKLLKARLNWVKSLGEREREGYDPRRKLMILRGNQFGWE